MKTIRCFLASLIALTCASVAADEGPIQADKVNEKELLARAHQLTQEVFELSKIAVKKAAAEKDAQFARRAVERGEEMDKRLTELAAEAGVSEPEKIPRPMQERLTAIEKLEGEAFDPDYLKMMLDLHGEHILVLEQLAKRADTEKLRVFAREALAGERAQLNAAKKLAAPDIPDAKPNAR